MHEKIKKFLEYFAIITKEESDYIESVLRWDDETKAAFFFAKRIFKKKECDDQTLQTEGENPYGTQELADLLAETFWRNEEDER